MRENTKDLYVKEERTYESNDGRGEIAEAIKRISERASWRIATLAGELAQRRQNLRNEGGGQSIHSEALVTITHKSNVLSQTDDLFRETARRALAEKYPNMAVEEQIVDSMVYKLFRQPSSYDVIVAPNLYGDILRRRGGIGGEPWSGPLCPFGAIGEPCHGSAPDIMGKGIANLIATIRSAELMLDFYDHQDAAAAIYKAVDENLDDGRLPTPDLVDPNWEAGTATTEEVLEDILNWL